MKVSVHYLFSKNDKIGSYLIRLCTRYLTKTPYKLIPSHVAILVNNRWVHESTVDSGIRVITYKKWLEINQETHKIKSSRHFEYRDIKNKFKSIKDKKYDWLGAFYFGLCIVWNAISKKPIPEVNKWTSKDKYFCSEVLGYLIDENLSMKSPVQIMYDTISQA